MIFPRVQRCEMEVGTVSLSGFCPSVSVCQVSHPLGVQSISRAIVFIIVNMTRYAQHFLMNAMKKTQGLTRFVA